MAELFKADDISLGWIKGMKHLMLNGGTESNLIIEIKSDGESRAVRAYLNEFMMSHKLDPIDRVADTIFPIDFYRGGRGKQIRDHLYKCQRMAARFESRFIGVTYFDRLIDWPYLTKPEGKTGTWNQLEYRIKLLKSAWDRNIRTFNVAEFGVSSGLPDSDADGEFVANGDMRTYHASTDRNLYGFPCLSHISLTLFKGRLDLTATYRNQHFINKAYGNFVGLMRLMRFIATEVGCPMGSLVCNATHADAEIGKNGAPKIAALRSLVAECEKLIRE